MSLSLRFTRSALAAAALLLAPAVASAQATMTFTSGCSGSSMPRGTSYTEAGFTLTTGLGFASWCNGSSNYAGDAMFINYSGNSASLAKVGGGTFSMTSIDLAHVYGGNYGAQSFTFMGSLFGGGTVSQSFLLAAQSGSPAFTTYNFDPSWNNLTSVQFANQDYAYYQFDNVTMDATTSTPEPASLALLGTGLVGIAGFARRRARRQQA